MILPKKISFHGRIHRDFLFAEKKVLCCRCKTRHMLGENCPVATTEDSGMSLNGQSDTSGENLAPVRPESSVGTQPSAESQQTSPPTQGRARQGDSSSTGGPALVLIQVQVQSQAMKMSLFWNLLLDQNFLRRDSLTYLLRRTCLLIRGLRLIRSQFLWGQGLIYP